MHVPSLVQHEAPHSTGALAGHVAVSLSSTHMPFVQFEFGGQQPLPQMMG
jgi:hypothetical protein